MLLALDVGNTNTVIGLFDGEILKGQFRVASNRTLTSDEAGFFITGLLERTGIKSSQISSVVIGSVVPHLTGVLEETARSCFGREPLTVTARIKLPVTIEIDEPDEVGADRIANAVAAHHLFPGDSIVVDFGTATTFDVINKSGAYIGGVIIPGPETAMAELAHKAARLFEVRFERPDRVVGTSTAGALKSGLFHGLIGQVDYIIGKIIEETGFADPTVVATGGLSEGIEKHSRYIERIEPTLTLEGLRLIGQMG